MQILSLEQKNLVIHNLLNEQVGIVPTDTVYGLVGIYSSQFVAKRILHLKLRDKNKPLAVIVSDIAMAKDIGVITSQVEQLYESYPRGKITIIVKQKVNVTETIAIRITNYRWLQDIVYQTGPLFATSANIHNENPIITVNENKLEVDFIVDGGIIDQKASTIIDATGSEIVIIRS
ncbi:L-threonylcarbamoyladenylate synthase [Spiroplasma endosymbiont of Tipula paludosa]|uniref:L-threonylcarbamoyladenylate synthase n=1 Tax=Spiroplasma endosymbiont of Tipula paludosa TaxID=3066295 RepID=UPI0035C9006D